jgi:hypothetical protein
LGIIIVEGTAPGLAFTEQERVKVVAEVQNGLGWLASQNPAGVTFLYDIHNVVLSVAPGPSTLTLAQKETLWRDPAMSSLGFGSGMAGVTTYVLHLRASLGTQSAYCAFFTKYPVGHFAYASLGGPRLVMHYENDNWGPDNIDRVFAHESGHIFGAPDEYTSSGCNCSGSFGIFGVRNGNCANCAPGGGVDCLMKQNSGRCVRSRPRISGFLQRTRPGRRFLSGLTTAESRGEQFIAAGRVEQSPARPRPILRHAASDAFSSKPASPWKKATQPG